VANAFAQSNKVKSDFGAELVPWQPRHDRGSANAQEAKTHATI